MRSGGADRARRGMLDALGPLVEKAGTSEGARRGWKTRRGQMGAVEPERKGPRAKRAEDEPAPRRGAKLVDKQLRKYRKLASKVVKQAGGAKGIREATRTEIVGDDWDAFEQSLMRRNRLMTDFVRSAAGDAVANEASQVYKAWSDSNDTDYAIDWRAAAVADLGRSPEDEYFSHDEHHPESAGYRRRRITEGADALTAKAARVSKAWAEEVWKAWHGDGPTRVFRGVNVDEETVAALLEDGEAEFGVNALSSWSTDHDAAKHFGNVTVVMDVSPEDVWGYYRAHTLLDDDEAEVVVGHAAPRMRLVRVSGDRATQMAGEDRLTLRAEPVAAVAKAAAPVRHLDAGDNGDWLHARVRGWPKRPGAAEKARAIVEAAVEKAGTSEGAKRGWRTRRGEMAAVEYEPVGPKPSMAEEDEPAGPKATKIALDWLASVKPQAEEEPPGGAPTAGELVEEAEQAADEMDAPPDAERSEIALGWLDAVGKDPTPEAVEQAEGAVAQVLDEAGEPGHSEEAAEAEADPPPAPKERKQAAKKAAVEAGSAMDRFRGIKHVAEALGGWPGQKIAKAAGDAAALCEELYREGGGIVLGKKDASERDPADIQADVDRAREGLQETLGKLKKEIERGRDKAEMFAGEASSIRETLAAIGETELAEGGAKLLEDTLKDATAAWGKAAKTNPMVGEGPVKVGNALKSNKIEDLRGLVMKGQGTLREKIQDYVTKSPGYDLFARAAATGDKSAMKWARHARDAEESAQKTWRKWLKSRHPMWMSSGTKKSAALQGKLERAEKAVAKAEKKAGKAPGKKVWATEAKGGLVKDPRVKQQLAAYRELAKGHVSEVGGPGKLRVETAYEGKGDYHMLDFVRKAVAGKAVTQGGVEIPLDPSQTASRVASVYSDWSGSAHSTEALQWRAAAMEAFGRSKDEEWLSPGYQYSGSKILENPSPFAKEAMVASKAWAEEVFRAHHGSSPTKIYRGVKPTNFPNVVQNLNDTGYGTIDFNSISSWSESQSRAGDFGSIIVEQSVTPEQVWGYHKAHSLYGQDEAEVVVGHEKPSYRVRLKNKVGSRYYVEIVPEEGVAKALDDAVIRADEGENADWLHAAVLGPKRPRRPER